MLPRIEATPARRRLVGVLAATLFLAPGAVGTAAAATAGNARSTEALPSTTYTYTVNTTADGNDTDLNDRACAGCGLRAAIQQANFNCTVGPTPDPTISTTIKFAISGSGVHTITPTKSTATGNSHPAALPGIVCPVVIDGTTQPGYAGMPLIELDGSASNAAGELASGLAFSANPNGSVVQGLAVNRWHGPGISLSGPGGGQAAGFVIRSNYLGIDPTGTVARPNLGDGIAVSGNAQATIGGTAAGEGNLVSGNRDRGLSFGPGTPLGSVVQGNYIGTDVTGTKAVPNGLDGIFFNGNTGAVIGGAATGAGNLISGNTGNGIAMFGTQAGSYTIQGNRIGTQTNGTAALGNGAYGVAFQNSAGQDVLGGIGPGQANVVAFNVRAGVQVGYGLAHRISGNSIFSNGGMGIDLTECSNGFCPGPRVNDLGDADTGPNGFQNFPVIASMTSTTTSTTVKGSLNSVANSTFTLEFFSSPSCDPTGYGEGKVLLGSKSVTTVGNVASFAATFSPRVPAGSVVTATATDAAGNTSEFSPCRGRLTVTPSSARAGTIVKVSGKGFGANQTVTLVWNCPVRTCSGTPSPVLGTVVASSTGSFSGKAIRIPAASPGDYWIGARTTAVFATVPFTVVS